MSLRNATFNDFPETIRRVRELAATPFEEAAWASRIQTFSGWNLLKDKLCGDHFIVIDERRDLFRNNEAYRAELDPDALIKFSKSEFSLWLTYMVDERLTYSSARAKFADAFADSSGAVCEILGEPEQRLHFVRSFLERMTFCACVWSFAENDLFLMQDIGDQQGLEAVIDLRILPRRPRPIRFPVESPFR